ncbi:MAG: FAD-dependent oxidoreductase [Puniceicoccales bacterium]|nr:FAD-dependent oxidoreductase [Puniceicoccales bacterium]
MTPALTRRQWFATAALGAFAVTPLAAAAAATTAVPATPAPVGPAGLTYDTDILVCGGGPAGVAAALNAARLGCKTLLIERYGRLGGMGVHARVWPLMGRVARNRLVREIQRKVGNFDPELADLHYADLLEQAGVKLLLHTWATGPLLRGNRITGVRAFSKQGTITLNAKLVIDATGDADIAAAAGVPCDIGREGDGLVQPMTIQFCVEGVADGARHCGGEEAARGAKLAGGETWESVTTRAQKSGELPPTVGVVRTYKMGRRGKACVNATQVNGLFGTNVEDLTRAELDGRRQAVRVVAFMRKHLPGYEHCYISHMPAVIGVRETRRIRGLAQLTRADLVAGRTWPDAIVRGATFGIDIHNPAGSGQAENRRDKSVQGSAARVKPYDIPARCVIPQNVDGLLVAGRCISGTHEAHASYRVQNISMAIGAGVGALAATALTDNTPPASTDIAKVQKILFTDA